MTLLIGLARTEYAILLADRRLWHPGKKEPVSDETNKSVVAWVGDHVVGIAFTGPSLVSNLPTDKWILKALQECGTPDYTLAGTLDRLAANASRDSPRTRVAPGGDRRLTIMGVGFNRKLQPPAPVLFTVSNFEEGQDQSVVPWPRFRLRLETFHVTLGLTSTVRRFAGARDQVDRTALKQLDHMVAEGRPIHAVVLKGVKLFRTVRDPNGRVGSQVNGLVIPAGEDPIFTYHSAVPSKVAYGPAMVVVDPRGSPVMSGIQLRDPSGKYVTGPVLHRRARCWCDSGRPYGECHGSRRGVLQLAGVGYGVGWGNEGEEPAGPEKRMLG